MSVNPNEDVRGPIGELPPASLDRVVAPLREARRAFERDYILSVLEQQRWSIASTARVLGLQRPNLYRKARQLRIQLKRTEAIK